MSRYLLRLYADNLAAKTALEGGLAAANRVLYVEAGSASLRAADQAMALAPNSAWCARTPCALSAGADGAKILRWELHAADAAPAQGGAQSRLLIESLLELDAADAYLFRCDRVDFPAGGIAYTHTHQGPGIRCLLRGKFTVQTAGHTTSVAPGEAWFEAGPEPVLATAGDESPAGFVRLMVLPRTLKGKSSIQYVKPEDRDKPKTQQYQVFIDEFIEL